MDESLSIGTAREKSSSLAASHCYHCQLPITDNTVFSLSLRGQERHFCCPGCQAVAQLIHDGGLDQFYRFRSQANKKPDLLLVNYDIYDRDSVQQNFVRDDGASRTAYLLLDGMTCAACVWLIEKYVSQLPGVERVSVNASTHQCTITWRTAQQSLSEIMNTLANLGYKPHPFTRQQQQQHRQSQQRQYLLRLGVAGFAMMQVGMVAVALYAGELQGMESQWEQLFRWVSLLVATPVVLFSAQPFWSAAWRHFRRGNLVMDVPVSLAIGLAYIASIWATITHTGDVYFDSIAMFTFFLLLGRYLEMRLRFRNQQSMGVMSALLPAAVQCFRQNEWELVPREELVVGDCIRVGSGDTIACDGEVVDGQSAVIEALLTGEENPVGKSVGDTVVAGTVNTDSPLLVNVTAVGEQMQLSTIERLVDQAQVVKPRLQRIADKVASYFVATVLLVAVTVFAIWYWRDPSQALWITLSVLVVTCPCALSLATPTAMTAATAALRQKGLLIVRSHVLETATQVDQIIFDKTGTLTEGQPRLSQVILLSDVTESQVLDMASALEQGSNHPIARAFQRVTSFVVSNRQVITGAGVEGTIDGQHYRLGKPTFVLNGRSLEEPESGQWLLLGREAQPLAWFQLTDSLRETAEETVESLRSQQVAIQLLSGDSVTAVEPMANQLHVAFMSGQTPEQKLAVVQKKQREGRRVLMVGDGINDGPVLAAADVSVAVDSATDFARSHADCVLLTHDLRTLPQLLVVARRTRRIIRQNLLWALGYNILALPLAATGFIPPYLAAAGMSLSSLIVVVNALRLYR